MDILAYLTEIFDRSACAATRSPSPCSKTTCRTRAASGRRTASRCAATAAASGTHCPKARCAYAEPAHPRVSNIHVQLTWLRCSQVWDTVVDAEAFASGELQSATEEEMWERFSYFLHELV